MFLHRSTPLTRRMIVNRPRSFGPRPKKSPAQAAENNRPDDEVSTASAAISRWRCFRFLDAGYLLSPPRIRSRDGRALHASLRAMSRALPGDTRTRGAICLLYDDMLITGGRSRADRPMITEGYTRLARRLGRSAGVLTATSYYMTTRSSIYALYPFRRRFYLATRAIPPSSRLADDARGALAFVYDYRHFSPRILATPRGGAASRGRRE